MNRQFSDLALAVWLQDCQRKSRIRQRLFRRLTDQLPDWEAWLEPVNWDLMAGEITESGTSLESWTSFKHCLKDSSRRHSFELELKVYERFEICALLSGHSDYPNRLREVDSAPGILYYRGQLGGEDLQNRPFVTVIGTRNPTLYGQMVTEQITADLARFGTVIVSGLARGIDTIAHETALEHRTITLAVQACGLDLIYPAQNKGLAEKILEKGAILSEHPPGVQPLKQFFPARNRILSGLSDVVAVMEASQKSGTLITAGFAADQGRDVFAVPGNILDRASYGCHQLIRDGAILLDSAEDILKQVGWSVELESSLPKDSTTNLHSFDLAVQTSIISPLERQILAALRHLSLLPEQLAEHLKATLTEILQSTMELELKRLIVLERGRYVLTALGQSSI